MPKRGVVYLVGMAAWNILLGAVEHRSQGCEVGAGGGVFRNPLSAGQTVFSPMFHTTRPTRGRIFSSTPLTSYRLTILSINDSIEYQ